LRQSTDLPLEKGKTKTESQEALSGTVSPQLPGFRTGKIFLQQSVQAFVDLPGFNHSELQ
jgi:hypothetical protein